MKLTKIMLIAVGIMAVCVAPASALTLYEQEGTADDGTPSIDATGQGDNTTNWKYQYGGGSWSGIYAGSDGWITTEETGDMNLEVEADIEMFFTQTVSNNKIYFHFGNIYEAIASDLTALVPGSFTSNNGQYIGISFLGTGKTEADFETDGTGAYTGVIVGGMQSDRHSYGTQDKQMDIQILLSWGTGWNPPVNYGDGAHSTITDTLWWLVDGGNPGTHDYNWQITLLPEAHQADGDYYLDPAVVSAPAL